VLNITTNIKQVFVNINMLIQSMLEIRHNDQTTRNKSLLRNIALKAEVLMEGSLEEWSQSQRL